MDDRPAPDPFPDLSPAPTEADLSAQLRAYGDALESAVDSARGSSTPDGADRPIAPAIDVVDQPTTAWRTRARPRLAAAAAVVVAIGSVGWWATDRDGSSLSTDGPTSTARPVSTETTVAPSPGSRLLPDLTRWALSDHSADSADSADGEPGSFQQDGIWVWRLEGRLITLRENVNVGQTGPRDQALLDISNSRTSLAWLEDATGFNLQGIDVDEPTLRQALAMLVRSNDGWDLPGADLVVAERGGRARSGEIEQITIVPRDERGVPVLSQSVQSTVRPGSPADLYRELHEASGGGTVSDFTVAGETGFLISGSDHAYALVAVDGQVFNWSAAWSVDQPALDLAALLRSTTRVTSDDWIAAVAGVEDTIAEVTVAAEIEPIEDTASIDLPRYTLAEPWYFEWVTDMGIWSPEQRAQRQALQEANTASSSLSSVPVRAQGFITTPIDGDPLSVPDVVIEVWEYEDTAPPGAFSETGGRPYSLGELEGISYDETTVMGRGAGIELAGGRLYVTVSSSDLTEDEIRGFADSLTARGGDPTAGFDSAAGNRTQLFELEGPEAAAYGSDSSWHGAWQGGDPALNPSISVERLSLGQLQLRLMYTDQDEVTLSSIEGGRYLVTTFDVGALAAQGIVMESRTTVMRYDEAANLLTTMSVAGTIEQAVELMEQLIEVDLGSWTTLVTPVNADPLRPR